jgi:hypothetical protein
MLSKAIKDELVKRIYGEPPFPSSTRLSFIDEGMVAGVNPFGRGADFLQTLVRQIT